MRNKRNLWILSECLWNVATIHCGCDSVFCECFACQNENNSIVCWARAPHWAIASNACYETYMPVNSCTRLICAYKQWRFHGSTSTSCVPLSVKCWHKLHAIFFACNDTLFFRCFLNSINWITMYAVCLCSSQRLLFFFL